MKSEFILKKLKEDEKFRLIFAKDAVLTEAVWALEGGHTDVLDRLRVFDDIEKMCDLDEELERELNKINNDLTNTDDFKITLSSDLESICEQIREIDGSYEGYKGIWDDARLLNIFSEERNLNFKMINEMWIDHLYYEHKTIFTEVIEEYKILEHKKVKLIEELEAELAPLRNMAERLLNVDEIESNFGGILDDIRLDEAYSSNFSIYFIDKSPDIINNHSIGLNEYERNELLNFTEKLITEFSIVD